MISVQMGAGCVWIRGGCVNSGFFAEMSTTETSTTETARQSSNMVLLGIYRDFCQALRFGFNFVIKLPICIHVT
jgi:hypothetical protein